MTLSKLMCWLGLHRWRATASDRTCRRCGRHQIAVTDYSGWSSCEWSDVANDDQPTAQQEVETA